MSLILDVRRQRLYPPQQTGLTLITPQTIALPAYRQPVIDPSLGNRVTRITDTTIFGCQSVPPRMVHPSTIFSPWNADSSLLFLFGSKYNESFLVNGQTGAFIRKVTTDSNGRGLYNNVTGRWSRVNPNNLYGMHDWSVCNSNNKLVVWHPKTDLSSTPVSTIIHTFSQFDDKAVTGICPNVMFSEGGSNLAMNDSLGVVTGWSSVRSQWGFCSFSIDNPMALTPTVTEIATYWLDPSIGGAGTPYATDHLWHGVTVTPYGDGIMIGCKTPGSGQWQGANWYSPDFSVWKHITNANSHSDIGVDENGVQMLVTACGGSCSGVSGVTPSIVGYPLTSNGPTGEARVLYHYGLHPAGTLNDRIHISCQNTARRGWCYVSDFQQINDAKQYGYQLIYALALDGSFRIEPYAINHGSPDAAQSSGLTSCHAIPSPDGFRILFASNWELGLDADINLFLSEIVS